MISLFTSHHGRTKSKGGTRQSTTPQRKSPKTSRGRRAWERASIHTLRIRAEHGLLYEVHKAASNAPISAMVRHGVRRNGEPRRGWLRSTTWAGQQPNDGSRNGLGQGGWVGRIPGGGTGGPQVKSRTEHRVPPSSWRAGSVSGSIAGVAVERDKHHRRPMAAPGRHCQAVEPTGRIADQTSQGGKAQARRSKGRSPFNLRRRWWWLWWLW